MPPTMNDVAMPIWFALMAIDVAKARSSFRVKGQELRVKG
jgi:hypothetical protein